MVRLPYMLCSGRGFSYMDTVTHALIGAVLYRSIRTEHLSKAEKRALLFTSLAGSELPDIDVVSQLWDTGGQYLMWHRGITHSVFLVPVWAALLTAAARLWWRVADKRIFPLAMLAVFVHITTDIFNPWGTGYWEPFSRERVAIGTVPIIDLVMWAIILAGYLISRFGRWPRHLVFRAAACLLVLEIASQTVQGLIVKHSLADRYDQVTLAADFLPGSYKVIGKKGSSVDIHRASVWSRPVLLQRLTSAEQADLIPLFAQNPAARTLCQWAPMVVVVDTPERLAVYDPRFWDRGESFLYEYIDK
jgi:inner membrane protein